MTLVGIGVSVAIATPFIVSVVIGSIVANDIMRHVDEPGKRIVVWVICMLAATTPAVLLYLAVIGLYAVLSGAV